MTQNSDFNGSTGDTVADIHAESGVRLPKRRSSVRSTGEAETPWITIEARTAKQTVAHSSPPSATRR